MPPILLRGESPGGLRSPHSSNRRIAVLAIRAPANLNFDRDIDGNEAALPRRAGWGVAGARLPDPFFCGPGAFAKHPGAPHGRGGRYHRRKSVRIRHILYPILNEGDGGLVLTSIDLQNLQMKMKMALSVPLVVLLSVVVGGCYIRPHPRPTPPRSTPLHELYEGLNVPDQFDWRNVSGADYTSPIRSQFVPRYCGVQGEGRTWVTGLN